MKILRFVPSRSISSGNRIRNRLSEHTGHLSKPVAPKRSTVDIADVENLSKFSTKWWDVNNKFRPLHALNPLRVQFVRDGLANMGVTAPNPCLPLEGVKILDAGCGGGVLTEPLARIGADMTGIDVSQELIETAIDHAGLDPNLTGRVNYVHTTIEDFAPQHEHEYDALVASEVLEHVNDKELFLKYCVDTVKPGGSIFLTTLNKTLPSWLGGIIAAEHVLRLVPAGTHDWNKFVTPVEIQRLLESYGCKTKLIHGMFYNPLKNEWFWTASTAINYAIHAVKREKRQ